MRSQRSRASHLWLLAAVALAAVAPAACASDDSSTTAVTTPATATTSTAAPAETSSTTARTPTTATQTTSGSPSTAVPTTSAHSPPTTSPTQTTIEAPSGAEYVPVAPPQAPSQTLAVPTGSTWPDGVYYATVSEGGDPPPAEGSVVFEVVQLFVGDACLAHFGTDEADTCVNDYGVETDPTASVEVALDDVYIAVVDAATQLSYRISGSELYRLISGEQPAQGAPENYFYSSGFGFFTTFEGGEVTRLEQWWTP